MTASETVLAQGMTCRSSVPEVHCKRNICLQAFARTSQLLSSHNPVRYCIWGPCGIQDRSCGQKTSPQAPKWGQNLSAPTSFWVGRMNALMLTTTGNKQSAMKAIIICFIQQTCVFPRTRLVQSSGAPCIRSRAVKIQAGKIQFSSSDLVFRHHLQTSTGSTPDPLQPPLAPPVGALSDD